MARFLLGEGEDLLARFRPHPMSYLPRYLHALTWILYGVFAWWIREWGVGRGSEFAFQAGAFWFAFLALLHAVGARVTKHTRVFHRSVAWAIVGVLAGIAVASGFWPTAAFSRFHAIALGTLTGIIEFALAESERGRRVHHLTNRRLVMRGGVGRVSERTLNLERVETVHGSQGALGQMFGFGTVTLTLESRGRRKEGVPAPTEDLHGVPHWEVVKHSIELALDEQDLSSKERQKRSEERRLKESMRALARWATERA